MTVKDHKSFAIEFDTEETKSAQIIDETLECILSLMEDEELTNMETKDVLNAEHIEIAQDVLRMLFKSKCSNWEY